MAINRSGVVGDNVDFHSAGGKARAEQLSGNERSSIASEGGKERAQKLSPERRSEIASKGGLAKNER